MRIKCTHIHSNHQECVDRHENQVKTLSVSSKHLSNKGTWDPALQLAGSACIALVSLSGNQKDKSYPIAGELPGRVYSTF